jgi:hypothetical protein
MACISGQLGLVSLDAVLCGSQVFSVCVEFSKSVQICSSCIGSLISDLDCCMHCISSVALLWRFITLTNIKKGGVRCGSWVPGAAMGGGQGKASHAACC